MFCINFLFLHVSSIKKEKITKYFANLAIEMSSKSNLKKRYFPSYRQIEQRILNEHKKEHDSKV